MAWLHNHWHGTFSSGWTPLSFFSWPSQYSYGGVSAARTSTKLSYRHGAHSWCFPVYPSALSSAKWVGLFTIATVGVNTVSTSEASRWRSCSFTVVYHALLCSGSVLDCRVHHLLHGQVPDPFLMLENPGEGDEFMNSEFHHTLEGRSMADTFTDVAAIGSTVTIRLINTQGGYLHWHPHN